MYTLRNSYNSIRFLAFVASILLFSSCGKDDGGINTVTDDVYISKITTLDPSRSAPFDTVSRMLVDWDASNRPVRILIIDFNGTDTTGLTETNIFYNASETRAYKTIGSSRSYFPNGASHRDTTYFTYSNNRLIRDSVSVFSNYGTAGTEFNFERTNYQYPSESQVKSERLFVRRFPAFPNDSSQTYTTSDYVSAGGNILSHTDTSITYSNQTATIVTGKTEEQNSYNTNPNPLYKVMQFFSGNRYNGLQKQSKNLGISNQGVMKTYYDGSPSVPLNYSGLGSYTFRSDGYPLTGSFQSTFFGTTSNFNTVYSYR